MNIAIRRFWKQCEELVIEFRANPFHWARLKLTVIYSVLIILGVIGYLLLLHRQFQRGIESISGEIPDPDRKELFITRANRATVATLYGIQSEDILMIFIIIGLSYYLSGLALKPIKQTLNKQREFMTNAAHHLKTPLSIVKTEMEVFLRNKNNFINNPNRLIRQRRSVLSNIEEIDRMSQTINDLLLVARIDSYQDDFNFNKINLINLINQTLGKINSYATSKYIKVIFNTKKDIYIFSDSDKLQHALLNILKNAIDYSYREGIVKINLDQKASQARLTIQDKGIGISKKDLPKIFNPFFRAETALNHNITGSGLGLSIVSWIIQKHNGKVRILSEVGKRTRVEITLPIS